MRITIVGCGAIGTTLAKAADEMEEVKKVYLIDNNEKKAVKIAKSIKKGMVIDAVQDELYHCDLVIEAASQKAAREILPVALDRGVDVMLMSVGVLVDDEFREKVFAQAKHSGAHIFIPSGALVGADALRAAALMGLNSVELKATLGPAALEGVKYLSYNDIDISKIKEKKEVYSATARDAVNDFPFNVNIAATASLLGVGFDKTKVSIVFDPKAKDISYDLIVDGKFGKFTTTAKNQSSSDNPTTSAVASYSAIAAMNRIVKNEWIGM